MAEKLNFIVEFETAQRSLKELRRQLQKDSKTTMEKTMSGFIDPDNEPLTISGKALLYEAVDIFKEKAVDNIIVVENNMLLGMIDVQDLIKMDLIS